jgi:hypothetical protein
MKSLWKTITEEDNESTANVLQALAYHQSRLGKFFRMKFPVQSQQKRSKKHIAKSIEAYRQLLAMTGKQREQPRNGQNLAADHGKRQRQERCDKMPCVLCHEFVCHLFETLLSNPGPQTGLPDTHKAAMIVGYSAAGG